MERKKITTKIIVENTEDVVKITQETTEKEEKEKLEKENMDELKTEEIGEAIMKIKMNKAAGIDEIQIEAWRYGGDKIKKREKLEGGFGWRDKFQRTGSRAS